MGKGCVEPGGTGAGGKIKLNKAGSRDHPGRTWHIVKGV